MAKVELTPFEEFWNDKGEFLENVDKETAELIWNSAVATTIHNVLSIQLHKDN